MFPKRFSLYCLFGVIKQKRKTLVEYENCPPLLCIMLLFSLCLLLSHFSSFLSSLSFLYNPYPPPSLTSSLSPLFFSPPSHLLLSILLTFPSALRSHFSTAALEVIHFTDPKKANYLRFYDFHYFSTHTGFYDWVVDYQHLVHTCTHTHTHVIHIHTCSKQYTHTGEERPEKHVYEDLDVCVYTVFGLCVKWRIMTPGQINHVGFKYIILSSREKRWAVPLSISNI